MLELQKCHCAKRIHRILSHTVTVLLVLLILSAPHLDARRNKPANSKPHYNDAETKKGKGQPADMGDMWSKTMEAARKMKGDFDKLQENVQDLVADINQGMEAALKGLETVQSVLEHSEDKVCAFTCQNGARPSQNPQFTPSKNGCGSYGMKVNLTEYPQFEECCDSHDECYDTCGVSRKFCDDVFHECLIDACDDIATQEAQKSLCQTAAEMIYAVGNSLGCKAYKDAQRQACTCDDKLGDRGRTEL